MRNPLFRTVRAIRGPMLLLATVLVMGAVQFSVVHERAFLNLYFVPVVLGAYRLGRRMGVYSALLSILVAVAGTVLFTNPRPHLVAPSLKAWMHLLDFATWGGILVLTAHLVGSSRSRDGNGSPGFAALTEPSSRSRTSSSTPWTTTPRPTPAAWRTTRSSSRARWDSSKTDVEDIRVGAWLHDIGKVESSMEVLREAAGPPFRRSTRWTDTTVPGTPLRICTA